ncbi:ATP-binding protein [Chlorogloeopsis sp. ULAP01]|uniref:ATP-binding protein n=1 Tax=Chlorogloeopsis sp. ULAP01 TaxID=3056483 RepID=UPI0025AAA5C3|nr:ATP-binding protein [Chlorogloeopsis sp. ULAP01]MDM9382733.1 ATP-binding protein [Chlorogloeopsis sp. ULAP01]
MLNKQIKLKWQKTSKLNLISSLRARLFLLVFLSIFPALGMIVYTALEQRRSAIAEVQKQALQLVNLVASNQTQASEGTKQLLIILSQLPELREDNTAECDRLLANLLKQYSAYDSLSVLNTDGKTVCSAEPARKQINLAQESSFQRALKTRKFAVGDYQIDRVSKKGIINYAYPILDHTGQVQLIAIAALNLAWLNQLAMQVQLPENSVLSVVDRQGTLLVRYPEPQKWVGKTLPKETFNKMVQTQEKGAAQIISLDGVPRIFTLIAVNDVLSNTNYYVGIGFPPAAVYSQVNGHLAWNLTALGVVAVLGLIGAWVGGDILFLRQVKSLVHSTQQLKNGNLSTRSELTDQDNELGLIARAFNDIAEVLEQQVNELKTLFDFIPVGIAITEDPNCHYIHLNSTAAKLFRLPFDADGCKISSQCLQASPSKLYHQSQEILTDKQPLQYAVTQGVKVKDVELDLVHEDGTLITLLCYAAPLFNQNGQSKGGICVFLDISECKHTQQRCEQILKREQTIRAEAEAAIRVKEEFLSVVSHELRSPLNPIIGWVQLLKSRKFDEKTTACALDTIERNALLQAQLVEDLLNLSHTLRGNMVLKVAPVDIVTIINTAIESIRVAAQAKNITIKTQFELNTGLVSADISCLQQVFWNLLSNAVKFTPSGGKVEVIFNTVDAMVQIQVKDTGKGIAPKFLPHVFEYFRQENSATNREFGGLGLGLALARYFTELHGGSIQAHSLGVGQGATFTVKLPLLQRQQREWELRIEKQVEQASILEESFRRWSRYRV